MWPVSSLQLDAGEMNERSFDFFVCSVSYLVFSLKLEGTNTSLFPMCAGMSLTQFLPAVSFHASGGIFTLPDCLPCCATCRCDGLFLDQSGMKAYDRVGDFILDVCEYAFALQAPSLAFVRLFSRISSPNISAESQAQLIAVAFGEGLKLMYRSEFGSLRAKEMHSCHFTV